MKIFESLATRERRIALMPAALKQMIASIGSMPPEIEDKQ
jgi:hypothetical protein